MINENYYKRIRKNWDDLAKPLDSLGYFEETLSRMGAILSDEGIGIEKATLAVLIADNGIIAQGISQSDESVTTNVAKAIAQGNSSVCHMAKQANVKVLPFNVGMKEELKISGINNEFLVSNGTNDFSVKPAMSMEQVEQAINNGKSIISRIYDDGDRVVLLGEMGIGNTTTSTAVIASLLGLEAKDICGRGAGLSDEGLEKKKKIIDTAINKYDLYRADPIEVLRTVGGYDIAAMVGIILEAIELKIPIILDGLITTAAALVAYKIDSRVSDVIFFSHKGREKGIEKVAKVFKQVPVIDGSLALGEGTGAVIYYSCLKTALSLYSGHTLFEDMSIDKYKRFE